MLTVSDGVHAGEREDASGVLLEELLREEGFDVVRRVVPDESELISAAIVDLATDALLVLTTGGTGFAPRDVTPEATHAVLRPAGSRHLPRRSAQTPSSERRTRFSRAARPGCGGRR